MAKSFSDQDKARLRVQLLPLARDLFVRQGLKKTSLEELTRPLGIAKSSFYLLFKSKEALYLEVLAQDGPAITAHIQHELDSAKNAHQGIVRLLKAIFQELETNALTRRMLTHPEELAQLAAHATPEQIAQGNRNAMGILVPYLKGKQQTGELIRGDAVLYARVISAVTLLSLHREQIGQAEYAQVVSTLCELLAKALTTA